MHYHETTAPEDLQTVVQATWVVEGAVGTRVRVVPDACVDLIALDEGVDAVLVNGPMPVAEVVELSAARMCGVRLVPGTLPRLDGIASLAALRGVDCVTTGPAAGGDVVEQLLEWVRGLLAGGALARDRDVDEALARMVLGLPTTATRRVGPRQMQRLFATYVGLSPQETFGVVRQSLVARALRRGDGVALATLAAEHGYADQSHLTRAFRRLAGVPPGRYRREITDDVFVQDPGDAAQAGSPS